MSVRLVCLRAGLVTLTFVLFLAKAQAQLNCGSVEVFNDIFQPIEGYLRVEAIFRTSREVVLCPLEVQAEGWVEGVGEAGSHRSTHFAEVTKSVSIPQHRTWTSRGKHWLIWNTGTLWEHIANTADQVATSGPPPPSPQEECLAMSGQWNYERGECEWLNCPLIIDTAENGYRLTNAEEGVRFDLNADGTPEQVAWTRPDSDDSWLAMDRNGNGIIDDGTELFGNRTSAYADEEDPRTANGFDALAFAEGPSYGPSLADRRIDARDAIFSRLLLWRDANHNGLSEAEELTRVSATDLLGIDTRYRESKRKDRHGNEYRQKGRGWWATPDGTVVSRPIFDVWLTMQP
jgi:hypothetical protein